MALPKYNYYPKDNHNKSSSQTESEKRHKKEVEFFIHKINDTLKQPEMARKAAIIIENLIKESK